MCVRMPIRTTRYPHTVVGGVPRGKVARSPRSRPVAHQSATSRQPGEGSKAAAGDHQQTIRGPFAEPQEPAIQYQYRRQSSKRGPVP